MYIDYNIYNKSTLTKDNQYDDITDLLVIDDNTFISSSLDNTIRVWSYSLDKNSNYN